MSRNSVRSHWIPQFDPTVIATAIAFPLAAMGFAQDVAESNGETATTTQIATDDERKTAEDEEKLQQIALADDMLTLSAPAAWKEVKPRSRIVEREFAVPPAENAQPAGRLTMMRSGGGVEANIERWKGQFVSDRDAESREENEVKELEVDGMAVHLVDLSGTFLDRPGPFAPGTRRPGYRMLGAILETEQAGDYFVKFYGPAKTVEAHVEAFDRMIRSIEWSGDR